MAIPNEIAQDVYKTMQTIRKFELQAAKSFAEGVVQGFVHLYIGEEAIATGVCANLEKEDYITSTHRGHGHLIAKGADINLMMAELCGRETGYCKGKGGSMHIADTDIGILGANGIVGGGFNLANGAALGAKMRESKQVAVCFFGDGATDTGAFHEAMNIASVWKLPIVFVNENNLYAITCRIDKGMNIENVADRALAYDIPSDIVDGNDVNAVYDAAKTAIQRARNGEGPSFLECKTYRWRGHFEGEPDTYRPPEEIKAWKEKDPIKKYEQYLVDNDLDTEENMKQTAKQIKAEVKDALKFAEDSAFPAIETALTDVYTDIVEEGR